MLILLQLLQGYSMSDWKMALPPLKISEPYRLVWGLLCLTAGIMLFGSVPNLWLAVFA